jgi:hypothetical protein
MAESVAQRNASHKYGDAQIFAVVEEGESVPQREGSRLPLRHIAVLHAPFAVRVTGTDLFL